MKNSTSFHDLSSDNKISLFGRVYWLFLNLFNNYLTPNNHHGFVIKNFNCTLNKEDWEKIFITSSPSRALSDLFWLKLNWQAIKSELGSLHVLDTGSGRGEYALKLKDFSDGIDSYLGIDLMHHNQWGKITEQFPFVTFKQQDYRRLMHDIPERTNLIISQSAIEHFESDLHYFKQLKQFIDRTKKNVIQIHLFPSAACLKLYLWHGVRQYTPRTITKIIDVFDYSNHYSVLFRMGVRNCNNLHFQYITIPLLFQKIDWRDTKTRQYRARLKSVIEKDMICGDQKPAFYALVIHSNCKKQIFI